MQTETAEYVVGEKAILPLTQALVILLPLNLLKRKKKLQWKNVFSYSQMLSEKHNILYNQVDDFLPSSQESYIKSKNEQKELPVKHYLTACNSKSLTHSAMLSEKWPIKKWLI